MKDDDFFAENEFEQYLLEGEEIVWSGGARPVVEPQEWFYNAWLVVVGVLPLLFAFVALAFNRGSSPVYGLIAAAIVMLLWSKAVLNPIRIRQRLKSARYAITNQRALILNGVVYRTIYRVKPDPIELRSIPLKDLTNRVGPDDKGSLTFGVVTIVSSMSNQRRYIGFYACNESEGAEIEILRLLGELPPAKNREFDAIPTESFPSTSGLEFDSCRRNHLI